MSNKLLHCIFILLFAVISVVLTMGRVGTSFNSFALLTGDLAVYTSLAVAQEEPELFANDPFLSNEKNTNSYSMIFFPMLKAVENFLGNYGAACIFLLPFFIFIHFVGFYLLGVSIFKNPWAGLYTSLLISVPISTYYDFWGIILDALPRFLYQGLIPFLMALSIVRGRDPKWWPAILGGLGLLNYVHPVSTPVWTIAMSFALWMSADNSTTTIKIRWMGLAIAILVVILTPFLAVYFGSTINEASQVANYDQVIVALQERFFTMRADGLHGVVLNFFTSKMEFIHNFTWYLMCALATAGVAFGLRLPKSVELHSHMRHITAWMVGVFLGGAVIPVVEQYVFAYLKQIPPEFELVRTLRYIIPLILLAAFSFLWMMKEKLQYRQGINLNLLRTFFGVLTAVLLVAWGIRGGGLSREFRDVIRQNATCWMQAQIVCSLPEKSIDYIGVMDAVRLETPIGSRVFSEGGDVAVRYYALRPLTYTYKDGAPLAYTDQTQFLLWYQQFRTLDELQSIKKFPARRKKYMNGIVEFAVNTGAEYIILLEPYTPDLYYPDTLDLVYTNNNYSLYKITPEIESN